MVLESKSCVFLEGGGGFKVYRLLKAAAFGRLLS